MLLYYFLTYIVFYKYLLPLPHYRLAVKMKVVVWLLSDFASKPHNYTVLSLCPSITLNSETSSSRKVVRSRCKGLEKTQSNLNPDRKGGFRV